MKQLATRCSVGKKMHRGVRINGETVRRLRRAKGWSQVRLAESAGVAERTVRNAEKGSVLESHIANYLAAALDVTLNEVVSERPAEHRTVLKSLTRKISLLFLRAVIDQQFQPFLELVHPAIQWNAIATTGNGLKVITGKAALKKHLTCLAGWWERFPVRPCDFQMERADAEGDMIYFLLTCQLMSLDPPSEYWQTFICRFEEELLVSVDHFCGSSLKSLSRTLS